MFPDYDTFHRTYSFLTRNPHTAMVILLNLGIKDITQTVFWYRPEVIHEPVQLHC